MCILCYIKIYDRFGKQDIGGKQWNSREYEEFKPNITNR